MAGFEPASPAFAGALFQLSYAPYMVGVVISAFVPILKSVTTSFEVTQRRDSNPHLPLAQALYSIKLLHLIGVGM